MLLLLVLLLQQQLLLPVAHRATSLESLFFKVIGQAAWCFAKHPAAECCELQGHFPPGNGGWGGAIEGFKELRV